MTAGDRPYDNVSAVLVTMHGKERAITPVLKEGLGLELSLATGVNTDKFGTFSRDVERTGSPLDAARAKIIAGFKCAPCARVGISSEGSFGPHHYIPFIPFGSEIVMLIDRERNLEVTGHYGSPETNYGHAVIFDMAGAIAFAERSQFPTHGLVVMGCIDEKPAPSLALIKDVVDYRGLEKAVEYAFDKCGAAFVEADMRAYRNPTRMRAIERAASDLVRRYNSICPVCQSPGYDVTDRTKGLPCSWCGEPTEVIRAEVLSCHKCMHREERPVPGEDRADPGRCAQCNP